MGALRWCRHCKTWITHHVHCAESTTLYTESAYGALRRAIDGGWDVDHGDVRSALDELDEAHPISATIVASITAARAEGYAEGRADMLRPDTTIAAVTRAKGYAEAVADVVAWLRARADGLRSHTYDQDDERTVLERVVDGIEDGAHVGAAKKGGS